MHAACFVFGIPLPFQNLSVQQLAKRLALLEGCARAHSSSSTVPRAKSVHLDPPDGSICSMIFDTFLTSLAFSLTCDTAHSFSWWVKHQGVACFAELPWHLWPYRDTTFRQSFAYLCVPMCPRLLGNFGHLHPYVWWYHCISARFEAPETNPAPQHLVSNGHQAFLSAVRNLVQCQLLCYGPAAQI